MRNERTGQLRLSYAAASPACNVPELTSSPCVKVFSLTGSFPSRVINTTSASRDVKLHSHFLHVNLQSLAIESFDSCSRFAVGTGRTGSRSEDRKVNRRWSGVVVHIAGLPTPALPSAPTSSESAAGSSRREEDESVCAAFIGVRRRGSRSDRHRCRSRGIGGRV